MPIWLRRFTFNTVKEHYDKEREEYEKEIDKSKGVTNAANMPRPPITAKPTYTTKAPKK